VNAGAKKTASAALGLVLGLAGTGLVTGCGGSPTAPDRDQVFYLHDRGVIDKRYSWERYFAPLDQAETTTLPRRVGVAVLEGDVRLSRPVDWYLRSADYTPERRFVSWQSPRSFTFTIFEKTDPVRVTWDALLDRYEANATKNGSEILAGRIPFSTANAQGREYVLKTAIPARPDLQALAHEIVVRSSNRVLLVQVVHGEHIDDAMNEIVDAVRSMLVY
jgi:hypothetical protein